MTNTRNVHLALPVTLVTAVVALTAVTGFVFRAEPSTPAEREAAYLASLRSDAEPRVLVDLGRDACSQVRTSGNSLVDAAELVAWGSHEVALTSDQAMIVVNAATEHLCP